MSTKKWFVFAPLAILGLALFVVVGGEVVKLLWNWLLPPLFGWPAIGFWQGLGILALCRILFGGCGFGGSSRSRVRDRVHARVGERMADRMAERMERMTDEERERFRQRVRERFGFGPSGGREAAPEE